VDYIAKPFQTEEVEARVATHLRMARLHRAQEAANRELELFAHTAAHDLRAPLQHVVSLLDTLSHQLGPLEPPAAQNLEELFQTTQRMAKLIHDLLAYAGAARVSLCLEVTDLDALVKGCLEQMADDLRGRRIRWELARLPRVWGDPSLLGLVVQNLLQNAVKFTRDRDEAVIAVQGLGAGTGFVVADNGVGFDPADAGRLFTPFTRLHPAEDFPGSGLGLAHVQRIVARHGGRVWAEGRPGQGASFHVALPGIG
jgi:signal transduction histidine kinase